MEPIDYIIALPVLWGIYKGITKGLISEIAQFAALVLGFMLGAKFSYFVSKWIIVNFDFSEKIVPLISFIIIFIGVMFLIHLFARLLTKVTKAISLGWVNYLGGLLIGGLKFLLIIGIVLQMIISNDKNEIYISAETKKESILLMPTIKITEFFTPYIKKALFREEINIGFIDKNIMQ